MTTAIIFIAVLALLIFVHELGHYVTAVRNGVGAHEFGFGFPPRIIGVVKNDDGTWELVGRRQKREYNNTIFSLNWIPLGGFVRIKGEDGTDTDPDSFATQSAWVRFKILVAGVLMNIVTAYVLFVIALWMGVPEPVPDGTPGSAVYVSQVQENSPAAAMGVRVGDRVRALCDDSGCTQIDGAATLQSVAAAHAGRHVTLEVARGNETLTLNGTLREGDAAQDRGALGIGMVNAKNAALSFLEIIGGAAYQTWDFLVMIVSGLGALLWNLLTGAGLSGDVAGPVGIAVMTGQMAALGLAQLAHFAAILSLNLAVINILPIPALDGGRILFVLIEKLRGGKPVNRNVEAIVHGVSFIALIVLMAVVTVRDVLHFF